MDGEETLGEASEILESLGRIEALLETIAENTQEYLDINHRLLASSALSLGGEEVDPSRIRYSAAQVIEFRELTLNPVEHAVTLGGEPVDLTPTEFDILFCLMRRAGEVVSCQELVREAQGYELDERDARYLIRPHITRLRQKLVAEPGSPDYIHNVRGVGYFFERRAKQRD
jgi:DNA-binding response OmpR family regulator